MRSEVPLVEETLEQLNDTLLIFGLSASLGSQIVQHILEAGHQMGLSYLLRIWLAVGDGFDCLADAFEGELTSVGFET